jgi:hypothetical protein
MKRSLRENAGPALFVDRIWRRHDAELGAIDMPGIQVFKTLADALRAGYQVYDRTSEGYLVRARTASGWALAVVVL